MLSEEEKKSIDKLKKIREDTIKANECGLSNNDFKEEIEVYNVVLNLITKLQKENELAKEQLKKQCEIADERNNLLVKVNRLESQIDLMAEEINETDRGYTDYCEMKIECDRNCKDCIKRYFERKVEE